MESGKYDTVRKASNEPQKDEQRNEIEYNGTLTTQCLSAQKWDDATEINKVPRAGAPAYQPIC